MKPSKSDCGVRMMLPKLMLLLLKVPVTRAEPSLSAVMPLLKTASVPGPPALVAQA